MNENNYFDKYDSNHTTAVTQDTGQPSSDDNYFNKYDNQPGSGNTSMNNKSSQINDSGAFMAGVENFNRMFGKPIESTLDAGFRAANSLSNLVGLGKPFEKDIEDIDSYSKAMDTSAHQAFEKHPIASSLGAGTALASQAAVYGIAKGASSLLSGFLPTTATGAGVSYLANSGVINDALINHPYLSGAAALGLGILGARSGNPALLNSMKENAVVGAGMGFLSDTGDLPSRLKNAAVGGVLGGVLPVAAQKLVPSVKEGENLSSISSQILTPNAAAANDILVTNKIKQNLSKTIGELVDNNVAKTETKINQGYKELQNFNIETPEINDILSNPTISTRLENINNSVDSAVKNLPDTNMAKLASVSKQLGKEIYNSTSALKDPGLKSITPDELPTLIQAKNSINDLLDSYGESKGFDYKALRQAAEKKILYEDITDALSKIPQLKGTTPLMNGDINTQNLGIGKIYDTLAGNEQKQLYFMDAMKSAGVNIDNVRGMLGKLNDLSIRGNSVENALMQVSKNNIESSLPIGNTAFDSLKNFTLGLIKGRYNNKIVELMLSGPEMQKKLSPIINSPTYKFVSGLKSLLQKTNTVKQNIPNSNTIKSTLQGYLFNTTDNE